MDAAHQLRHTLVAIQVGKSLAGRKKGYCEGIYITGGVPPSIRGFSDHKRFACQMARLLQGVIIGNSRGWTGVRPLVTDLDRALRSAVPVGAAPLDDAFTGTSGFRNFRGGSQSGCWG